MPTPAEQGRNRQAARQERAPAQPNLAEPVVVFDGSRAVTVSHNEEKDRTEIHITARTPAGDVLLHSLAVMPNNDLHTIIPFEKRPRKQGAGRTAQSGPQATQKELLAEQENEHPPITIEGRSVRGASYDKEKQTYRLVLAHHPNPNDLKEAVYYDLIAQGDKARECYAVRVTTKGIAVHVTGDEVSHMGRKKDGGEERQKIIRIDTLEKLPPGQLDSSEIRREKVPLPDRK